MRRKCGQLLLRLPERRGSACDFWGSDACRLDPEAFRRDDDGLRSVSAESHRLCALLCALVDADSTPRAALLRRPLGLVPLHWRPRLQVRGAGRSGGGALLRAAHCSLRFPRAMLADARVARSPATRCFRCSTRYRSSSASRPSSSRTTCATARRTRARAPSRSRCCSPTAPSTCSSAHCSSRPLWWSRSSRSVSAPTSCFRCSASSTRSGSSDASGRVSSPDWPPLLRASTSSLALHICLHSLSDFSNKYWLCSFFSLTMAYDIGRNIALLKWEINEADFLWIFQQLNTNLGL